MRAARIHRFGPPEVIQIEEAPVPTPGPGEVVVRVDFAGVGPWDALVRTGTTTLDLHFPIVLGSDLSGSVATVGAGVTDFRPGDEVFGVTNPQFIGAYAEFARASARSLARRPWSLSSQDAGGVPVVADMAWEMLVDRAVARPGQSVLILGAGGNVGVYAVQLARRAGLTISATAGPTDVEYVRSLGADHVFDYRSQKFDEHVADQDVVIDLVGGESQRRALAVLRPGGILVSAVAPVPEADTRGHSIRTAFFLADVTAKRLARLSELFDRKELVPQTGTVLPLEKARVAHEMLAGAPHDRGKIVLSVRHSAAR